MGRNMSSALYGNCDRHPQSDVALVDAARDLGMLSARMVDHALRLDEADRRRLTEILRAAR